MGRAGEIGAFLRFAAGSVASVLAGWILFRADVFDPESAWFQCVTVGALLAGVLALIRRSRPEQALLLSGAYTLVQIGYAWTRGWEHALRETVASAAIAGGAFISSVLFDFLDHDGYRFGKFALLGPLVAGVFVASTCLALVGLPAEEEVFGLLVRQLLVGLVVGDAVGLGVELVELVPRFRAGASHASET